MGSIRVNIDETGTVASAQDYYAYGEILRAVNSANPYDKYKFTEKERDTETDYDYINRLPKPCVIIIHRRGLCG